MVEHYNVTTNLFIKAGMCNRPMAHPPWQISGDSAGMGGLDPIPLGPAAAPLPAREDITSNTFESNAFDAGDMLGDPDAAVMIGSDENRELQTRAWSNSYSAEGNRLMNARVSHHYAYCRVCVGMLKHRLLDRIQACIPSGVCSNQMNSELQRRALSNGF